MNSVASFSCGDSVENLSFKEIELKIGQKPALIIPFGGTEPYGPTGVMGIASLCVGALAAEISKRLTVLKAPVLPFGCSGAFMAFSGTSVLKPATFKNICIDLIRGWITQGITDFIIINGVAENGPVIQDVAHLLGKKYSVRCMVFDLHRDEKARAFYDLQFEHIDMPERSETAMMSMACYLNTNAVKRGDSKSVDAAGVVRKEYLTWRKRGMDPQKLKKMIPGGLVNPKALPACSEIRGETVFRYLLKLCGQQTASFLEKV